MYPRSRFFPPQGQKNKIQSTYSYAQYPQNSDPAAVLIRSVRFGECWIALTSVVADTLRVEEQAHETPRPVLLPADVAGLPGKSETAIKSALEVSRVFGEARIQ